MKHLWLFILLSLPQLAFAWLTEGHERLSLIAVQNLPKTMPDFFVKRAKAIAHHSTDPDVVMREKFPYHNRFEKFHHYLDLEATELKTFPTDYNEYEKLLFTKNLKKDEIGDLPYAIMAKYEELTLCFAQHRKWPKNIEIQNQCVLVAGNLAHYAQDLTQPLHTTIHHNGRVQPGNPNPRSSIHKNVDALAQKLLNPLWSTEHTNQLTPIGHVFDKISEDFIASHKLVDRVYDLEANIPDIQAKWVNPNPELERLIRNQAEKAIELTARLFITAWTESAAVQLPFWLERSPHI